MNNILSTQKVRQGALILYIQPDGSVQYEVFMTISKEYHDNGLSKKVKGDADIVKGRKGIFIKKTFGTNYKAAMKFKINLQLSVTAFKTLQLDARHANLYTKLKKLK